MTDEHKKATEAETKRLQAHYRDANAAVKKTRADERRRNAARDAKGKSK